MAPDERVHDRYFDWIHDLYLSRRYPPGDRIGSLNEIDGAARSRGVSAIRSGRSIGLSRRMRPADQEGDGGRTHFRLEAYLRELRPSVFVAGDRIHLDCHGFEDTHIDALNHLAYDSRWYEGREVTVPPAASLLDLADLGIFTRAIHVDIPALRDSRWLEPDEPVTSAEIERGIALAGLSFRPGDALLLDCGRDRYEAANGPMRPDDVRGGCGTEAAGWLADARPSLLCWDMLDVSNGVDPPGCVHALHWAIGLVLIDNCDFAALRCALEAESRHEGALVVAPLRMEGATGGNVNPQVLL